MEMKIAIFPGYRCRKEGRDHDRTAEQKKITPSGVVVQGVKE